MKKLILTFCLLALSPMAAFAAAAPGQPAPDFSVADSNGKTHSLADYKGKWIVLEWFNKDCPYVKKHYGSNNMQNLQRTYTAKNVAWLQVISSAKGKQGYLEPAEALKVMKENNSAATATLLDVDGKMGQAYGAKTTPHMFVINPEGKVVYAGAIDDNDSSDAKVIPTSKNYVAAALDAGMSGKKIETASSRPYGCSVKY